jgi:hypothetical protein
VSDKRILEEIRLRRQRGDLLGPLTDQYGADLIVEALGISHIAGSLGVNTVATEYGEEMYEARSTWHCSNCGDELHGKDAECSSCWNRLYIKELKDMLSAAIPLLPTTFDNLADAVAIRATRLLEHGIKIQWNEVKTEWEVVRE